jgi:hypothetical protein
MGKMPEIYEACMAFTDFEKMNVIPEKQCYKQNI